MINQYDIQADCIGTLAVYPKLFKHCVLKPEYFLGGFETMFKVMKAYFEKTETLVATDMAKVKDFDVDLYMKCSDLGTHSDPARFKRVQKLVIDAYKERQIQALTGALKMNAISLERYDREYNEVMGLHVDETTEITEEDFLNACRNDKKNIFFLRFRRLGVLMRLKENDFMIVAGATGSGKSGFALNLLEDLSKNYKCLYFNLEMVPQELLQRLVSIKSGLTQDEVGTMNDQPQDSQARITKSIKEYTNGNIHIIHKSQTLDTIRANLASNNDNNKHTIVIIDHIGLIGTKARNSYERMTEIAKELRKYSLDFNCTIIGLCQLNRNATKAGEPSLSMLRDSGEIEQSASKVLFVWNDDFGYSLVLKKNRSGPLGYVNVGYNKQTQRMEEFRT